MGMFDSYKYEWKSEIREIGPASLWSHFEDGEWNAACHAMVKVREPNLYAAIHENDVFVEWVGYAIYLEERYEYLLYLTDSGFSKAGTHPQWVADAIGELWQDRVKEEIVYYVEHMQEESNAYLKRYLNVELE